MFSTSLEGTELVAQSHREDGGAVVVCCKLAAQSAVDL